MMKNRARQRENRRIREDMLELRDLCGIKDPTPYETVKKIVKELRYGGTDMEYTQMLTEYDDVLSPKDVMKILQTGRNTVYKYLAEGKIRSIMVGGKYRIPKLYLLEFIYPDIHFTRKAG